MNLFYTRFQYLFLILYTLGKIYILSNYQQSQQFLTLPRFLLLIQLWDLRSMCEIRPHCRSMGFPWCSCGRSSTFWSLLAWLLSSGVGDNSNRISATEGQWCGRTLSPDNVVPGWVALSHPRFYELSAAAPAKSAQPRVRLFAIP